MNKRLKLGFSLVELLLVTAILGTLLGLLLPAAQKARESANRSACENNLRQLGLGLQTFHDAHQHFPANTQVSFYVDLLPFVEQPALEPNVTPAAVKIFLCPSRRSTEVGPRADYAASAHPLSFIVWSWPHETPGWKGVRSVLGTFWNQPPCKREVVATRDGLSNTAVLAHKGLQIMDYNYPNGQDLIDPDFDQGSASGMLKRYCGFFGKDVNGMVQVGPTSKHLYGLFTSPHAIMPVLRADGSVTSSKLGIDTDYGYFFGYNDRQPIDFSDFTP